MTAKHEAHVGDAWEYTVGVFPLQLTTGGRVAPLPSSF